jgi:CPA2 family monovalent cation:H+ antiporter-2
VEHGTATFLLDLTAALVAASIFGGLARAAKVTPILGYVLAGIVIGPFTPGYQINASSLGGLSELGLILLLFSLGLGFSARELRSVGVVPMVGNLVLMACFAVLTWGLGILFHFPHPITLGLAFTLSSTAIGVALLQGFGLLDKRAVHMAIALLVAQDLVAVLILVITTAPAQELSPLGAAIPLLKAALFVIVALVIGATVLHRVVIGFLRRAPGDAMIAFCTGVALVAAWLGHVAGLSYEFGAFVAGAVTSEAAGSRTVQSIIAPFRELFVMLFFVSIGTLVDVRTLLAYWPAILTIGAILAAARFGMWYGLSRFIRQPAGTAVALGIALLPLGEFNVVLANNSLIAKRLGAPEYATVIGATLLSIVIAAVAARLLEPRRRSLDVGSFDDVHPFVTQPAIVIVGYGRVGRTVGAICARANVKFAVIETDVNLVRLAQREGAEAQYGDGTDPRVVDRAIAASTQVVLSTIPDTSANLAITRQLSHRPGLRIVVRARRLHDVGALRGAGASDALVPETEGAFGFAEVALTELGLDADQIAKLVREQRAATP